MSESLFANRATIGERYVTKGGWPITIIEIGKTVIAQNDLTGERHKLDKDQLLWPFNERLISKEAITMARAKGHRKVAGKKTRTPNKRASVAVPKDGDRLVRHYNGKDYEVACHADGYYLGTEKFSSLTAVAKKITGYPSISGPAFFRAAQPAQATAKPDPALTAAQ